MQHLRLEQLGYDKREAIPTQLSPGEKLKMQPWRNLQLNYDLLARLNGRILERYVVCTVRNTNSEKHLNKLFIAPLYSIVTYLFFSVLKIHEHYDGKELEENVPNQNICLPGICAHRDVPVSQTGTRIDSFFDCNRKPLAISYICNHFCWFVFESKWTTTSTVYLPGPTTCFKVHDWPCVQASVPYTKISPRNVFGPAIRAPLTFSASTLPFLVTGKLMRYDI